MSGWEKNFVEFALAKPEGKTVKVYKDRFSYVTLSIGESVTNAIWAGNELNVYLANGKVRRYKDKFSYRTI
jgi:hypothetical protein